VGTGEARREEAFSRNRQGAATDKLDWWDGGVESRANCQEAATVRTNRLWDIALRQKHEGRLTIGAWVAAGVAALLMAGAVSAGAQETTPNAQSASAGLLDYVGSSRVTQSARIPPIPKAPFSAKVLFARQRRQPDGTLTTGYSYAIVARDGRGRLYNESRTGSLGDASSAKLNYVVIYDPSTQLRTLIYPATHTARSATVPFATQGLKEVQIVTGSRSTASVEELGTKTVDGLELTGLRHTRAFEADPARNIPAYAVVTEAWYSAELQVVVLTKRSDPRFGEQTLQLTEIKRGEPDAALFEVPQDYQVEAAGPAGKPSDDPAAPFLGRIRQGGNVTAASLVTKVNPTYPEEARKAHISGTVRFRVIIGKDGGVQQMEVISGHPLLVQASLDAVEQWKYRPTQLDGQPVEVDTTIDVIFQLNSPPKATP
jgi:TonB family protein